MKPLITVLRGPKPGKKIAIFCGIHGNEKAGIMVVDYLKDTLRLIAGEVVLVYANPLAIERNVRLVNKNLNRRFIKTEPTTCYEDNIAAELMELLDTCDALLDLHSYHEPLAEGVPFLICEANCFDIASKLDFKIVASGFDGIEKGGTDGYMFNQGKVGVCAELGATEKPGKFKDLGIKTAYQFLNYYGLVEQQYPYDSVEQSFIKASLIYKKTSPDFTFSKKFKTFDYVLKGEEIAKENGTSLLSPCTGRILFPRAHYPVGTEAFILAEEINER